MNDVARLMSIWLDWHIKFGTWVGRSWAPKPASEAEIREREAATEGPSWPDEIIDFYRWSNGGPEGLLPAGQIAKLSSLHSEMTEWRFNESSEVACSLQLSCYQLILYLDIAGPARGMFWAMDEGDTFPIADSLTEYLEAIVYLAEKGMIQEPQDTRTLSLGSLGNSWGPATSAPWSY